MANQISSKVYWSNTNEELAIRIRAKTLGKTVSRHLRDLAMQDLYQSGSHLNKLNGVNEEIVNPSPSPIIPHDATFFQPGELENLKEKEDLENEEINKLLRGEI